MDVTGQIKGAFEDLKNFFFVNMTKPELMIRGAIVIIAMSLLGVFVVYPLLAKIPGVSKILPRR